MASIILAGALVRVYINDQLYKEAQSVSYDIDYGETAIYGIDMAHPQEIAPTRSTVTGQISGIKIKNSGGLQAVEARPLMKDLLASPYISIRIQDRFSNEDLLFIPRAKVKRQNFQVGIKGTAKVSFQFEGLIGLEPLDRS